MPDPIRTMSMLPALFDAEAASTSTSASAEHCDRFEQPFTLQGPILEEAPQTIEVPQIVVDGPPMPGLKTDPYERDRAGPRRVEVKGDWSAESFIKYLKGVPSQIDANLQNHGAPNAEKLDAFVEKLVFVTRRQTRHAPKKMKQTVRGQFTRRFRGFWDVVRNEKIRSTTPDELKNALYNLIEGLNSEFGVSPDLPARHMTRPVRLGR